MTRVRLEYDGCRRTDCATCNCPKLLVHKAVDRLYSTAPETRLKPLISDLVIRGQPVRYLRIQPRWTPLGLHHCRISFVPVCDKRFMAGDHRAQFCAPASQTGDWNCCVAAVKSSLQTLARKCSGAGEYAFDVLWCADLSYTGGMRVQVWELERSHLAAPAAVRNRGQQGAGMGGLFEDEGLASCSLRAECCSLRAEGEHSGDSLQHTHCKTTPDEPTVLCLPILHPISACWPCSIAANVVSSHSFDVVPHHITIYPNHPFLTLPSCNLQLISCSNGPGVQRMLTLFSLFLL